MSTLIALNGARVLVKPDERPTMTGLIHTDKADDMRPVSGTIVSMGPDVRFHVDKDGRSVGVGDWVMFMPGSGKLVTMGGEGIRILQSSEVIYGIYKEKADGLCKFAS